MSQIINCLTSTVCLLFPDVFLSCGIVKYRRHTTQRLALKSTVRLSEDLPETINALELFLNSHKQPRRRPCSYTCKKKVIVTWV